MQLKKEEKEIQSKLQFIESLLTQTELPQSKRQFLRTKKDMFKELSTYHDAMDSLRDIMKSVHESREKA